MRSASAATLLCRNQGPQAAPSSGEPAGRSLSHLAFDPGDPNPNPNPNPNLNPGDPLEAFAHLAAADVRSASSNYILVYSPTNARTHSLTFLPTPQVLAASDSHFSIAAAQLSLGVHPSPSPSLSPSPSPSPNPNPDPNPSPYPNQALRELMGNNDAITLPQVSHEAGPNAIPDPSPDLNPRP